MSHIAIRESFVVHLLYPSFTKLLITIKNTAQQLNKSSRCMVSYAWPLLQQEEGLQERVLEMCEDLAKVGIDTILDISKGQSTTNFGVAIPEWVKSSEFVVLVGSTSYPTRAKDHSTLTHMEAIEIGNKKQSSPNSIIPVLFEGRFGSSFPPGFQDTIGGRFIKPTEYIKEFPGVAASILGVSKQPEIARLLESYYKDSQTIIETAVVKPEDIDQIKVNMENQKIYWQSRVLVLRSKFSLEQRRLLDGNINIYTSMIDSYCSNLISNLKTSSNSVRPVNSDLLSFLSSSDKRVLLLCTQPTHVKLHFTSLALSAWETDHTIPVFVDLASIDDPVEDCVEKSLIKQGLTLAAIKQAKVERRSFLFLVSGFEESGICTNLYMQSEMFTWPGRVVFSISPACYQLSPTIPLYFTPSSLRSHHIPDDDALKVVSLLDDEDPVLPQTLTIPQQSKQLQQPQQPMLKAPTETRAGQEKPESKVVQEFEEQLIKGFLLLQRDIIRIKCQELLSQLPSLSTSPSTVTVFISYAWPQDPHSRDELQKQLLDLVEDLSHAGIKVLLDIMQLQPGSDVKKFMENEIKNSNAILWIGTPDLKARIKFDNKGHPTTNAAVEFVHIRNKSLSSSSIPWSVQALWFRGKTVSEAYPDDHGLTVIPHDFTQEKDYYSLLPLLAGSILGIANTPQFEELCTKYKNDVAIWEASFTPSAIQSRLQLSKQEAARVKAVSDNKLRELLSNIPSTYIKEQEDADHAKTQSILASLSLVKQTSLSPDSAHSQSLEYYIPLKLGKQHDSLPLEQVESQQELISFLDPQSSASTMLLYGFAGSGKSLFARFIEQTLWKAWDGKQLTRDVVIPVYISLPLLFSTTTVATPPNLAELAFNAMGFTHKDTCKLSEMVRFLFILDGLDEVAIDALPHNNFLTETRLSDWLSMKNWHNKVVVMCRTQHAPVLENKLGQSIPQYLASSPTTSVLPVFHLMPFNNTQIQQFLIAYSQSIEVQQSSSQHWPPVQYEQQINSIRGLSALVQNPFLLKLVVRILPSLTKQGIFAIDSTHVYQEFSKQMFHREAWKRIAHESVLLESNLIAELQILSETIAQILFASNTTSVPLTQLHVETKLLASIPVYIVNRQVRFIHKSVQEFFVSQAWIGCLDRNNFDEIVGALNSNFVSREMGVLDFVSQQIQLQHHGDKLLKVVTASRIDNKISMAASNAISILNQSRLSFSNMTLSGISVPEAYLSYAIMEKTDLSHSDLSGSIMQQVWMRRANLQHCQMANVQLGELPWITLSSIPQCFCSSNEKFIIGLANKTIEVWDVSTMKQIGDPLLGHTLIVTCIAVHDGKIVSGSNDMTVRVWDLSTLRQIGDPLQGHTAPVRSIAVHDGKIASGSEDKTVCVWDLLQMKQIGDPLTGHTDTVVSITICDGKIISGSFDKTIRVWDISTMKQIGDPLIGHTAVVLALAAQDGKIVSGSADVTVRVWDLATLKQIGTPLIGHTSTIWSIAIHDGKIASGSADSTVRFWDLATMKQIGDALKGHNKYVICVGFYEGKVVSGSYDKTIRIWNISALKSVSDPLHGHSGWVESVAAHKGKIVSVSSDETVRVWDFSTMKPIGSPLVSHTGWVMCVAVHEGKIFSGGEDATIRVWDLETMKLIGELKGHTNTVRGIATHRDRIVSVSEDNTIRVWDIATMQQIGDPLVGHTDRVACVTVHDGKIFSGSRDNTIRVWDLATMQHIGGPLIGHSSTVTTIAVADGKIVSGSHDKTIRFWDIATLQQIGKPLRWRSSWVTSIAIHDGKIFCGGKDKQIKVYDIETMQQIGEPFIGHAGAVMSVVVHDGKIISGSEDKTLRVWDITGAMIRCSTTPPLCFNECNVEGVKGLSPTQARLLQLHGPIGTLSQ